jgi:predicted outer membrane repeat protein
MGFADRFRGAFSKNDENVRNFQYLDDMICTGKREITLSHDIVLENSEKSRYKQGIEIDCGEIIIDGNGHSIDALKKASIFNISSGHVTLKNITFLNGKNEMFGAAITSYANVNVFNCTFRNNQAKQGSAISSIRQMKLVNCVFLKNHALLSGAALSNGGEMLIDSCEFSDNESKDEGGAIYNGGTKSGEVFRPGSLVMRDTILRNNKSEYGGAIANGAVMEIADSTLSSNRSKRSGGAIRNTGESAVLKIKRSRFIENVCSSSSVSGGAIWTNKNNAILELSDCEFKNNKPNDVREFTEPILI